MSVQPARVELLELDVDTRLVELWREASGVDFTLDVAAAFMRAAYAKGYCDALTEPTRGLLCIDHGYKVPARLAA